jgi:hypothetical protein
VRPLPVFPVGERLVGQAAEVVDPGAITAVFEIGVGRAPAAIAALLTTAAVFPVFRIRRDLAGQGGDEGVPSLLKVSPAQVIPQAGVLDVAAESEAAIGIQMEFRAWMQREKNQRSLSWGASGSSVSVMSGGSRVIA